MRWIVAVRIDVPRRRLILTMLNAWAMSIAIMSLMIAFFASRKEIGVRWIVWTFELLLLTVLIRRIDELSHSLGMNLIDQVSGILLSWAVVVILAVTFVRLWRGVRKNNRLGSAPHRQEYRARRDTRRTDNDDPRCL